VYLLFRSERATGSAQNQLASRLTNALIVCKLRKHEMGGGLAGERSERNTESISGNVHSHAVAESAVQRVSGTLRDCVPVFERIQWSRQKPP